MSDAPPKPSTPVRAAWSSLNLTLHWLVLLLILGQFLDSDGIIAWWDQFHGEAAATTNDIRLGWAHIGGGLAVFLFTAVRIADRALRGRPPYPSGHPIGIIVLSKGTHLLIFAILLIMPAAGLAAWISGSETVAGIHTFLWTPLLALVAIHVIGALAEHFYFKTDVLRRMLPFGQS